MDTVQALRELKNMCEETDIYAYTTEADRDAYISWLKEVGAWDELTDEAKKEIAA